MSRLCVVKHFVSKKQYFIKPHPYIILIELCSLSNRRLEESRVYHQSKVNSSLPSLYYICILLVIFRLAIFGDKYSTCNHLLTPNKHLSECLCCYYELLC